MRNPIELIEVSPRDGLQNETAVLSTVAKLELIERALAAGIRRIEVASFVHPELVPQMADAEAVVTGLPEREDVVWIGLTLNDRGLDRALATGRIDEIGCVAVASDGFGLSNQRQTVDQSIEVSSRLVRRAHAAGLRAQVTISAAFGCPFDGEVDPGRVVDVARRLAAAAPDELAIADTIGVAVPDEVSAMLARVRDAVGPELPLRVHFHNTRNTGIANACAALDAGIDRIDASIGGIGGCPFAPRATGNIPTEDLLYILERSGRTTGVALAPLIETAQWLESQLGHRVAGMVSRAGSFPG